MPRIESPKKRLPFFVRLKTMADMKEVAKNLAEIKAEVSKIFQEADQANKEILH